MKRILIGSFFHETNRFGPHPADLSAYRKQSFLLGDEVWRAARPVGLEGTIDVCAKRDDVELIPACALNTSPSGPVTAEVYGLVQETFRKVIRENKPFDGVLLALHGAMVADGHDDGEGDLLELIREELGVHVPTAVSLDLHANLTEKMLRYADILLPYNEYPHTDDYETHVRVTELLLSWLDGKTAPKTAVYRIPFQLPLCPTALPAMKALYDLAKEEMKRPEVLEARFTHGFFPADIEDVCVGTVVITDGNEALAKEISERLGHAVTERLPDLREPYPTLDEALSEAEKNIGTVVIGDTSDNAGAGAPGDTTHILREILRRGLTGYAIASILDPETVTACIKAGVGSTVSVSLGGKSDPALSGGPIECEAYVKLISDGVYVNFGKMYHLRTNRLGPSVLLSIAGNDVIVVSNPIQPLDSEVFRAFGITPERRKALVVKSSVHYRAAYGQFARQMFTVPTKGFAPPIPEALEFQHWKR